MSMFEDSRYQWRETYLVLFDSSARPMLRTVKRTLSALDERYTLTNLSADDQGRFDSLTLLSPDDFSALDICYTSGEEVLEHAATLLEELERVGGRPDDRAALKQIQQCDARLDVLHFEQVPELPEDDYEPGEILDPSALLLVLGALAKITGGIAVDPQSGSIIGDDQ